MEGNEEKFDGGVEETEEEEKDFPGTEGEEVSDDEEESLEEGEQF